MKKLFYFMTLACIMMLASCSSDLEEWNGSTSSGDKITIGVGMPGADGTRVSTADLLNLTWEDGDQIVLLGYDNSGKYIGSNFGYYVSGAGTKYAKFSTTLINNATKYRVLYKGSKVSLTELGTTSVNYKDQSQNGVNNSEHVRDYLSLCSEELSPEQVVKGASLKHMNSILRINVKGIPALIEDANTVYSLDLYINGSNIAYLYPNKAVKISAGSNNYFYMVFDPSTVLNVGGEFTIVDNHRTATVVSPNGKHYKAGKIYTVTLDIKDGKWIFLGEPGGNEGGTEGGGNDNTEVLPDPSQKDWANKTFWVKGVNVPSIDKWGLYSIGSDRKALEWTAGQGWYDCTKYLDGKHQDENLCWAATCSNMIYWWLDQNKANIEKYGKYNGPKNYVSALDCEIFQYFNLHFDNYGCMIENGFDWFFKGKHISGGGGNATSHENPVAGWPFAHTGFFKDVVGNSKLYRISTGADFNENLKIAFLKGEAIGLDISVSAGRGAHAVTIWGAKFDANGQVCELYEAENNDVGALEGGCSPTKPGKESRMGLFSHPVKLVNGVYTLESSSKDHYTIPIRGAYFLSSNQKEWDAYFAKQGK